MAKGASCGGLFANAHCSASDRVDVTIKFDGMLLTVIRASGTPMSARPLDGTARKQGTGPGISASCCAGSCSTSHLAQQVHL